MPSVREMIFKKTSGIYDDEQAYRQRVQKYNEAVNQLQYNEQTGQFDYLKGSDLELKGQFNQAQGEVFQQLLGELNMVKQEVQQVQKDNLIGKQANAVYDAVTGQDFETLNNLIGTDEKTRQMFQKLGVQAVHKFDPSNPQHVQVLQQSGAGPYAITKLLSGELPKEQMDLITKAWPIVQSPDNKLSLASLPEFIGMTKMDSQMGSSEKGKQIRDFISRSYSALQGITDSSIDAKVAQSEAQTKGVEFNNEMLSNWASQFEQENGRPATIQDYLALQGKYNSSSGTADMRDAQYFGNLKIKIDKGEASEEEIAIYDEYMMKRGGVNSARNRAIGDKGKALLEQGIDISDPNFDASKLPSDQKILVNEVIRSLETTEGGKKLTYNIAKKLGDDLGAVESTAHKLTELVTAKNVSTDAIMNATSKVRAYLPEGFRNITAEDLRDQEFRSAYLSAAAVFLKLQSGLTVNEAEAGRFNNSFGTLNKNTKVNMTGLKTKLDEVIASYEKNSLLEPDLYNLKYKSGVEKMKQTSRTIDNYLHGENPASTQTALPPEKVKQLDLIFGGGL